MFSIHQCDRLGPLAEHLFGEMERNPLPPLKAEVVVVAQNTGLRGWLQNALARRTGCAASVAMPSPRKLCLRLARAFVPAGPAASAEGETVRRDPFDPEPLAWRIAAFLEGLPEEARYAPLHAYLREGPDRRLPLARRIAERFSDYQVYRPRLLQAWTDGDNPHAGHAHAGWQAALWRRLTTQPDRPDRARQLLALQEKLREDAPSTGRMPARVSVFGAGLFPKLYLDVLTALAQHVPVRYYLVGGRRGGDGSARQRRLGGQRGVLCDLLGECAGEWSTLGEARPAPDAAADTALHAAQAAIRAETAADATGAAAPFVVKPDDRSVSVHSCHSPRRELEVLRDQLFDAFEALPDLEPGDVLVAAPGLEQYAPLIETTFEAEEAGGARLPVHIASAKHGEERRVLQAMEALLALPESRCTAAEVMELLDYPVLRRAAGLAPEEVPVARRWAADAGVQWGRAAEHRAAFDLPPARAGTWAAGLDRLLLGYVAGPTEGMVAGRLPCAEATADRADLLGRLATWLHRLFSFAERAQAPRPLADWGPFLTEAIANLLAPERPAEYDAVEYLVETAQELASLDALARGEGDGAADSAEDGTAHGGAERTGRVPFTAVREHVEDAVHQYEARAEHVTGRITFAEPMALRFAPYRVVAFLGLGNAFPPTPARPAYDLIAADPRPADHDAEREGEQLFCDALLAAEDRLILTYVGRSEKDDSERAPSAVLDAFFERCEHTLAVGGADEDGDEDTSEENAEALRERLVTEHPLQPFHPGYFTPGRALFSYDRAHGVARGRRRPVPPFATDALPEEDRAEAGGVVPLDALQRAWAHPARFFCTRVLGLRLEEEAPLATQEPIDPGGLAAYQVREATLRMALDGAPPETWADRVDAAGTLPPGHLGRAWFDRQRTEAEQVARVVEAQGARHPRRLRAGSTDGSTEDDRGTGWAVTGRLDHVAEKNALAFRCATPKAKDFARVWAAHLLLCAADEEGVGENGSSRNGTAGRLRTTLVIGTGGSGWRFGPLRREEARRQLHRLVRGYRSIRTAPPPLFPKTSMTYVESGSRWKTEQAFYDGWDPGEESDPYLALCFRGRDPLADDFELFERWARAFWKPLLACREEVRF